MLSSLVFIFFITAKFMNFDSYSLQCRAIHFMCDLCAYKNALSLSVTSFL